MKFSDAQKVRSTITASDDVEKVRSANRGRINDAMNGAPPLTESEAKKSNLRVNCNFGEMPRFAAQARRQYSNAFLKPGDFFRVKIPSAPPDKRQTWEMVITRAINRPMKKSKRYFHLKQNQFASVVAHGIGPQLWDTKEKWIPHFLAIEDCRVPTDTQTSLENLQYFAARYYYSPWELAEKAFGAQAKNGWKTEKAEEGWKKEVVQKILKEYEDQRTETTDQNWTNNPEKMYELWKQNGGYYSSDAVPTIPLWHFYYKDEDGDWKLKVVCDDGVKGADYDQFVYDSDKPVADDIEKILHVQFGDLNVKAPFLWHSVRALGFLLMEPAFFANLLQCRLLQHVFEAMNVWLRTQDPAGKGRAQKAEFFDRCIVPEGVSIVPQTERHQIPADLITAVQAQMRQYMAEASSAYTQDIDRGTQKEETAYAVSVKMAQANAMLGAILSIAFYQEKFAYAEICRRFCIKNSSDSDVRKCWQDIKKAGIPQAYMNVDLWDIEPDVPIGSGNPTMEQAIAQQLLNVRNLHSPTAQQKILHLYDEAVTGNPELAQDLAPMEDAKDVSGATEIAELAFGSLMQGVPIKLRETHSPIEIAGTLLGLLAGKIVQFTKGGNMAGQADIAGMSNVLAFIDEHIQLLAMDPNQKQAVKQLSDSAGKLANDVKGFAQRLAEQNGNGNGAHTVRESLGMNYKDLPESIKRQAEMQAGFQPATEPVTDPKIIKTNQQMQIKQATSSQKEHHADIAFEKDQTRKDAETLAQISRDEAAHKAKIEAEKAAPKEATPA